MELKEGMICKHFKGETLIEKNIYQILAVNVTYVGDNGIDLSNMVIYKPLFQEGKVFAREYDDLVCELTDEQKEMYQQVQRVEPLTDEELMQIKDDEFVFQKLKYTSEKYGTKKTV
ncbi:MAG: hypothetical protein K2G03_04445 [Bacilli bacterium]|nr:hypothetical protein [Bacilli bacterium]